MSASLAETLNLIFLPFINISLFIKNVTMDFNTENVIISIVRMAFWMNGLKTMNDNWTRSNTLPLLDEKAKCLHFYTPKILKNLTSFFSSFLLNRKSSLNYLMGYNLLSSHLNGTSIKLIMLLCSCGCSTTINTFDV